MRILQAPTLLTQIGANSSTVNGSCLMILRRGLREIMRDRLTVRNIHDHLIISFSGQEAPGALKFYNERGVDVRVTRVASPDFGMEKFIARFLTVEISRYLT